MKKSILRFKVSFVFFVLGLLFVIKFAGPAILKLYVETGMGGCQNQPIFSIIPEEEINNPPVNTEYLAELTQYNLPEIKINLPKNFTVIKQSVIKRFYKRRKVTGKTAVAYLFCEKPNFFVNLFPQIVSKTGIKNDYEFLSYTMSAKTKDIKNIPDAFFSIMKSLFTPNMGDQQNLKIVKFNGSDKKGFITFNINKTENYFDCNFVDKEGGFFKLYLKDIPPALDLNKVLTIISTVKNAGVRPAYQSLEE